MKYLALSFMLVLTACNIPNNPTVSDKEWPFLGPKYCVMNHEPVLIKGVC